MKRVKRQFSSYKGRSESGYRGCFYAGLTLLIFSGLFFLLPGVRFSACLLLGGAALCFLYMILKRFAEISRWGKGCKAIFLASILAISLLLCGLETAVILGSRGDLVDIKPDAVIVLGAGVNGERPSLSLQSRIDAAAEYVKALPDVPILLSGGQGKGEEISEAEAMRRGLLEKGIPEERLFLEERSRNTAENFVYSRELLLDQGLDLQNSTIAFVSNDFHLFRAKLLAEREGMAAIGVPARLPWWLGVNYYLREAFALVKTILF